MPGLGEPRSRLGRTARNGLAAGLSTAATWGLVGMAADAWPTSGEGPPRVDDVLHALLAWLAAGLAAWLSTSAVLAMLATVPGAVGEAFCALTRALTPHLLRRMLSLGVGATMGVVALPAPAAVATSADDQGGAHGPESAPAPAFVPSTPAETAAGAPSPGWVPDRPTRMASSDGAQLLQPALRPAAASVETVTVRRGDTLWSIAARHLGPRATESEIAAEWPRWYAANRAAIGADPGLIRPGEQLLAPGVVAR